MLLFLQVGKYQALPVSVQYIFAAGGIKHQPAARGKRLQQQLNVSKVLQRLVMADTLYRGRDSLFVQYGSGAKAYIQSKPFFYYGLQHFPLYLTHKAGLYFTMLFVPYKMQLRVFLLKLFQLLIGIGQVGSLWEQQPVR